ncbi:MAG: helix-turn-helix domain-containing protein [Phycisphaerae bacterium]
MSDFLTVEEAAQQLGVEYKTVYHLVRRGEIPAGKIGRIYRIRRDDLESYFERQKEAVARQARGEKSVASSELRCGGCGRRIVSELSIGGQCVDCGEPICQACWMVKKMRHCGEHAESGGGDNEQGSTSAATADRPGEGGEVEGVVKRLRQAGKPVLERGRGVVEEEAFLRTFAQRFEAVEVLPDPLREREIPLREARVKHMLRETRKGPDGVPGNRTSIFRIKVGGWGKPMSHLFVQGRFCCHPDRIDSDGYDAEPIGSEELLAMVNDVAAEAKKADAFHVVLASAPVGWSEEAVAALTSPAASSPFRDRRVGVALEDLAAGKVHLDESDERLWPFWAILDPSRHEAKVRACMEVICGRLTEAGSVSRGEAEELCGADSTWAAEAMRHVANKAGYHLDDIEGVGLVLSGSEQ